MRKYAVMSVLAFSAKIKDQRFFYRQLGQIYPHDFCQRLRRVVSLGNFGKRDAGRPNFQSPLVIRVPFGSTAFTVTRAPLSGGWQPRMLRPQFRSRWLESNFFTEPQAATRHCHGHRVSPEWAMSGDADLLKAFVCQVMW